MLHEWYFCFKLFRLIHSGWLQLYFTNRLSTHEHLLSWCCTQYKLYDWPLMRKWRKKYKKIFTHVAWNEQNSVPFCSYTYMHNSTNTKTYIHREGFVYLYTLYGDGRRECCDLKQSYPQIPLKMTNIWPLEWTQYNSSDSFTYCSEYNISRQDTPNISGQRMSLKMLFHRFGDTHDDEHKYWRPWVHFHLLQRYNLF